MTEISELETILSRLSKEELVQIVANVCEQDSMLKNSLLLKYGKGKTDKQQIQALKKNDQIDRKKVQRKTRIHFLSGGIRICGGNVESAGKHR
ncbi:hypothetical protein [Cohnella rhizosphaerae]|uniref:Uncharacterized protein n=1 Tax=Cohnella rhizosphaerae TaxID=1457232 RepID=A0A9X4KUV8_9BACL|nr:hypothetical protein [Cohnella rhizosphaerae]MDG0810706.1 hypothetical protein [Cohnella rhizosphaerae]